MPSLLFVSIVAVEEVEVGRRQVPKVDFRHFQEWEAQNDGSLAKSHRWRRHAEADMVVACHLGGRLGMDLGLIVVFEGWVDFLAQSRKTTPNICHRGSH